MPLSFVCFAAQWVTALFCFRKAIWYPYTFRKDLKALYINLKNYGLSERFEREAAMHDGLFIARVSEQHRKSLTGCPYKSATPAYRECQ